MALAALGFEWAGAPPKITIAMLVSAWLIMSISSYRHRFFEAWPRWAEIFGNIAVSAVIAAVLVGAWLLLHPK